MRELASQNRGVPPDLRELARLLENMGAIGQHYVVLLGLRNPDTAGLIRKVHEGLPYQAWERLVRNTALSKDDLLHLVRITSRTMNRRKEEGRLTPNESDRLLRACRVFAAAFALFEGNAEAARHWLTTSQPGLGGAAPVEFASTEIGAHEVEALIGRLEDGIPS